VVHPHHRSGQGFVVLGTGSGAGVSLRAALGAHLKYEHASGIRRLVSGLQIALSVPVWLSAARPAWVPPDLQRLVLAAWAVCLGGLLWTLAFEWRWHRRCVSLVEAPSSETQVDPTTSCTDERGEAI
jgi:hypothetical protein